MSWSEFWSRHVETLGVTLAFAFAGSGFLLWVVTGRGDPEVKPTARRALTVIIAGQFCGAIATAFAQGYLGWSPFVAPLVGAVCGLVGLPIIMAVAKSGRRADGIVDAGIDRVTGARKDGGA